MASVVAQHAWGAETRLVTLHTSDLQDHITLWRDRKLDVNTMEIRRKRADLQKFANPQAAVDDLKGKFGRPTQDIPGVVGKKSINNQSAGK
jgi:hypothetical protein